MSELDPNRIHHGLVDKGHEKARTAAYATTTDRLRKQVRAKWQVHHINEGCTVGKAAELALLEPEYIEACERAEAAEEEAGKAAVDYAAAVAWLDVWRTLESTKRAEMQLR